MIETFVLIVLLVVIAFSIKVATKERESEMSILERAVKLEERINEIESYVWSQPQEARSHCLRALESDLHEPFNKMIDLLIKNKDQDLLDYMATRRQLAQNFYEKFMTYHKIPVRLWR